MDNFERIVSLNNGIEANVLESVLKEKKIPHIIRSNHDTALNGIYQTQHGWGSVEAPLEFRQQIIDIYNDIIKNRDQCELLPDDPRETREFERAASGDTNDDEGKKKKINKPLLAGFIVLIGIIIFFLIENSVLRDKVAFYELAHESISGDVSFKWDDDSEAYVGISKTTGKIVQKHLDTNQDGRFDTIVLYDKDGAKSSEKIDKDLDGKYDTFRSYNKHGDLRIEAFDTNEDGNFDASTDHYSPGSFAVWFDNDSDGFYDILEIHDKNGNVRTVDIMRDILQFPK